MRTQGIPVKGVDGWAGKLQGVDGWAWQAGPTAPAALSVKNATGGAARFSQVGTQMQQSQGGGDG